MRFLITLISVFFITGASLRSADLLPDSIVFAHLTDLHVNPGSASDILLQKIVDEINDTNVDFTVVTGDLSNSGSDAELLAVKKSLDKLTKPCYVIPGNHETNWSESAGLTFNRLWGDDRFLFSLKEYLFVGFNTGPFMKMGDGHVKEEDILWLKRQLQKEEHKNKVLISFSHYPLNEGLDNWVQVTELLKSFGCRIDLCGHGHKLAPFNFNGITGIMGRSVILGNSADPGYNIVKLRNDSVLIYNKELSVEIRKPVIALNYLNPGTLSEMPISPLPDFSVNQVYKNREVVAEWSDTASIFSGPCLVNDTILVYGNSTGLVKGLDIRTLNILWQTRVLGPVYSTPVTSDGRVVLGTVDGNVIALDALNGKLLWQVKTGRPVLAEGLVEDGSVYLGGGDRSFYRIDIKTGNILWQYSGVNGPIQGKPAVSDSAVIFGAWDRHLYCLDKITGTLRWKWNNAKPQTLYSPGNIFPVCSGKKVFIVAPDRYMTAIDLKTGKEIWRTNRHRVRESMGVSPDGTMVYAKLMNDTVIAMSALENFPMTKWALNAGFGYEHNPCPVFAADDLVIVGTRGGMLVAIDPVTCTIVWKYKAGNSSINKVIADQYNTYWITLTEGKILGIKTIHNQNSN